MTATHPAGGAAPTAEQRRRDRLAPQVKDALALLEFAAANGRPIEPAVRDPLIATADAVDRGTPTLADEQAFFRAYEALTLAMAPVTAETLVASRTVLPRVDQLLSAEGLLTGLKGLTLGRFVNAISFIVVLVGVCLALAYYSLGATTFERYQGFNEQWTKVHDDLRQAAMTRTLAEQALKQLQLQEPKATPEALQQAQLKLLEAQAGYDQVESTRTRIHELGNDLPDRLWRWSRLPCEQPALAWLMCTAVDRPQAGAEPPLFTMKVEAARATVARMNDIVLPLLLGWLGAHAYVLRHMTAAIAARTLAKGSMLHTLVRLSLGALAGFSSSWLLTPELVAGAQLKQLPAWALAFVAGYGIELVFAFMDRIIAAFTNKAS